MFVFVVSRFRFACVLHELYKHNFTWRINVENVKAERVEAAEEAVSGPERRQRFQFGPWLFNVVEAQRIIARSPRDPSPLPVAQWARFYGLDDDGHDGGLSLFTPMLGFDRAYALTTDLSTPVLVATLEGKEGQAFPLLIDGTHRLFHAYATDVAELPAYVLTVEESRAIREDGWVTG